MHDASVHVGQLEIASLESVGLLGSLQIRMLAGRGIV